MVSRGISAAQVLLASLMLTGCGSFFIGFSSNQGVPSTATGKVLASSLVSIKDHTGLPLTITRVTLTNGGVAGSLSFCGDQEVRFPLNATVKVEFTSNIDCMTIVDVVVVSTDPFFNP
jgi:hypothetical protein